MESYLFFNADPDRRFDDGEGNDVSLGEHLEYLATYGGTPDCWDSFEGPRARAMREARESGLHLYVVDTDNYRVVGVVNPPGDASC